MELRPVDDSDLPWLWPAFCAYLDGLVPGLTPDRMDHWWREPDRAAYGFFAEDGPVGFALIRQDGSNWEVSEFTILPAFRRQGLGVQAAHVLLATRPGLWQLGVVKKAQAAAFWARALTGTPLIQDLEEAPPLQPSQSHSYRFRVVPEAPHV